MTSEEADLNLGDRVHLIAGHWDGVIQGFGQKFDPHRHVPVPAAFVLWDGEEQAAWWALDELEPGVRPNVPHLERR